MSGPAIAFMVVVATFIWGGFAALLTRAVRREAAKSRDDDGA